MNEVLSSIAFEPFCIAASLAMNRDVGWPNKLPNETLLSQISKETTRLDRVYNFQEEKRVAKEKYGAVVVKVINMVDYGLQEQARIAMDSAVYIAKNHGGVGATSTLSRRIQAFLCFGMMKGDLSTITMSPLYSIRLGFLWVNSFTRCQNRTNCSGLANKHCTAINETENKRNSP